MIKRSEDFVCVCTGNTFGNGEDMQYIGRNILDAATKDRFASLFIDYSPVLEQKLIPRFGKLITELREYFKNNGTKTVVSTRGGIRLEKLYQEGKRIERKGPIVSALNLNEFIKQDQQIVNIIDKHVGEFNKNHVHKA